MAEENGSEVTEEQDSKTANNIVTIESAGPCKKKVNIEIPEATIQKAADDRYKALRKEAQVPGFRVGRAPRRLLEKRYGKETSDQIKLQLLAEASDAAVKDNEIDMLGEPDIDHEKVELPESGSMKFEFEVEVRPEFALPELEGIAVKKTRHEVSSEQVDGEIEYLQKWSGIWVPREDGAVEVEDQIIADAILKIEGVEEDEKLDNIEIFARANSFIGQVPVEKMDELLVGAKAGDTRKTSVEVPKTFFNEDYRGKKIDVEITVKDIKWLKPADLNEDFLKKYGVDDEKELREKISDVLGERLEKESKAEMTEQIYDYMLDKIKFDLPLDLVADQVQSVLQRKYIDLLRQGLAKEQIEEQMDQLKAGSEGEAHERLKTFFIMEKVAQKLEIDVTEEEINGFIAQMALQQGQRPEKMRDQMVRNGLLAQFRSQIRDDKCISKLLETAEITEVKPSKKAKKSTKKTTGDVKKQGKKMKEETTKTPASKIF